jgi:HPr kinase/phosphorylase
LIADDVALLNRTDDNTIFGHCPEMLQDFLNVRGLGVLNVRRLYGDKAVIPCQRLDMIIRLENNSDRIKLRESSALSGFYRQQRILGISIPELTMLMTPGRDYALWVECAVNDLQLRSQGYNAAQELQNRLNRVIARQSA